jgi:hypothetical protein
MRRALTLLLLAGWATAAPAPPHRPRQLPDVTPGEYALEFGTMRARVTLEAPDGFTAVWHEAPWRGTWHWDRKTRTLHVAESPSPDGTYWQHWSLTLDGAFRGHADYNGGRRPASLTRLPPPSLLE